MLILHLSVYIATFFSVSNTLFFFKKKNLQKKIMDMKNLLKFTVTEFRLRFFKQLRNNRAFVKFDMPGSHINFVEDENPIIIHICFEKIIYNSIFVKITFLQRNRSCFRASWFVKSDYVVLIIMMYQFLNGLMLFFSPEIRQGS